MDIAEQLFIEKTDLPAPLLWINKGITNFYDFTEEDIRLENYQYQSNIKGIDIAI